MASVSLVLRTYNALPYWPALMQAVTKQSRPLLEVVVVDSESTDGTVKAAQDAGARVVTIPQRSFTHARSTNLGFQEARGEWVAMLSQDALPRSPQWLALLTAPLEADSRVAAVFGRQIPRPGCFPPEAWELGRSYPAQGPPTVLYSNVSSVARKRCWQEAPFDETVRIAEDRYWAQEMMRRGYRVAYAPEAEVWHSHEYTLKQAFTRCREEARARRDQEGVTQGPGLMFKAWPKRSLQDGWRLAREGKLHLWPKAVGYRLAQFSGMWAGGSE